MIEIRIHGRGGQGAVTSAEMIALAAIEEQKYAQGFPSFGPERRGAPVVAFARVDERPIRLRSKIYQPDVAVVLDPTLLKILDPSGTQAGRPADYQQQQDDPPDQSRVRLPSEDRHRGCGFDRPGRIRPSHYQYDDDRRPGARDRPCPTGFADAAPPAPVRTGSGKECPGTPPSLRRDHPYQLRK